MILFNQIIEVLDLSELTAFGNLSSRFEFVECFGVGSIFIYVDDPWCAARRGREGFEEKMLGCLSISRRAQPKIERLSIRIDGPIEVDPLFFDCDGGFIDTPRVIGDFEMRSTTFLDFWSVLLNPAINRGGGDEDRPAVLVPVSSLPDLDSSKRSGDSIERTGE